jgi:CubicO group peptidase (beta-lactamase class C family)
MISHFGVLARCVLGVALLFSASVSSSQTPFEKTRLKRFEREVDGFRSRLKIPALSVAVLENQQVILIRGLGFADVENRVPATPDTVYSIASLTKTFASTLIMQLVEQGKLDLDEPVSHDSSDFKDDSVEIKHLLSHTSAGVPGERFEYDGNRFDYLTAVIQTKTGKPFLNALVDAIFDPLAMSSSVPYHNVVVDASKWAGSLGNTHIDRYKTVLLRLAQPYSYYGAGEIVHDTYPSRDYLGAAAGILSTVRDLARYDIAIDRHVLLKKETQESAWTPFVSNSGERLPYGLGWFVTHDHGHRVVWHYGQWGSGFSAVYVKVPERHVSIILLANSEALADLDYEEIANNAFVCSFLGLWGYAYDCAPKAELVLTKWIQDRRAKGKVEVRVDKRILEGYAGDYQFEKLDNRIYTVWQENGKLFFKSTGGSPSQLFAESQTTFFLKTRPYVFVFTVAEGQPSQLKIVQGDKTYLSKRIK